jgi:hypothetical protein
MKLVLDRWQGLGDNLQVSTIPRRYFEKYGEKCVWISDAVKYRSPEIRKLVWENNPYIAGFTDEPGINYTKKILFNNINWIEQWEKIYELNLPFSNKPEIYCSSLDVDLFNMSNKIMLDISYSQDSYKQNILSNFNAVNTIKKVLSSFIEQSNYEFVQIKNTKLENNNEFINFLDEVYKNFPVKTIEVANIEEYCNTIKWCKQFICTHSGCHVLASAVREKSICFIPRHYYNINYFVFNNVRYVTI